MRRGPELLPVLREAGVVDAGGYGVIVIFAGVVAALRGEAAPALAHHAPARISHPEHDSATFRYCTNFAVTGAQLDAGRYVSALETLGDSVLVVGDQSTLKVHVHTDDPETAIALFADVGEVSHLDVADMRAQVAQRDARLTTNGHCGRSAHRRARRRLRRRDGAPVRVLGAHVLDGGPTLNPSTHELLAGIHAVPSEEVVVLPNSSNVFMAAERAASCPRASGSCVALPAGRPGRGGGADPRADADTNAGSMRVAIAAVRTGAVAPAAREDAAGRFGVATRSASSTTARGVGGDGDDTGGGARGARGRRRARDLHRGGGRAARGEAIAALAPVVGWSPRTAASRRTGGC